MFYDSTLLLEYVRKLSHDAKKSSICTTLVTTSSFMLGMGHSYILKDAFYMTTVLFKKLNAAVS